MNVQSVTLAHIVVLALMAEIVSALRLCRHAMATKSVLMLPLGV